MGSRRGTSAPLWLGREDRVTAAPQGHCGMDGGGSLLRGSREGLGSLLSFLRPQSGVGGVRYLATAR